jgi:hypothetical protein
MSGCSNDSLRISYNSGTHRIEVNVTDQFQQIVLSIDHNSLVSALKQMSCPALFSVSVPCIAKTHIPDQPGKKDFSHLHDERDVVAPQAQCRDANIESLDSFFQQIVQTNPVRLVKENILAGVPA